MYRLNADSLLNSMEDMENARAQQAAQSLQQLAGANVLGQTGMGAALRASNSEIAAMALARARGQGPSIAGQQAQEAMQSLDAGRAGRTMGEGVAAANQAAAQRGEVAAGGGMMRAQESMGGYAMGAEQMFGQTAVDQARQRRQQELALAIMQINAQAEQGALGRRSRRYAAERGIQSEQAITNLQRQDAWTRTLGAGGLSALGSGIALAHQATRPSETERGIAETTRQQSIGSGSVRPDWNSPGRATPASANTGTGVA